jgi:hypothetical protein
LSLLVLTFLWLGNVIGGVLNNPIFCTIWVGSACLQALIVEFGSVAFKVSSKGLSLKYWLISIGIGAGVLPWQQLINTFFYFAQQIKLNRNETRKKKAARQAVRRTA